MLNSASITVDGSAEDWTNVSAMIVDASGDQNGNSSTDLISLRAVRSGDQLVLLMETDGAIALPHTPAQGNSDYSVGIHFHEDPQCLTQLGYYITGSFGQNNHRLDNHIDGETYSTEVAYQSSFLETSFSISLLPSGIRYVTFNPSIGSYSQSGEPTTHDDFENAVGLICYQIPF